MSKCVPFNQFWGLTDVHTLQLRRVDTAYRTIRTLAPWNCTTFTQDLPFARVVLCLYSEVLVRCFETEERRLYN